MHWPQYKNEIEELRKELPICAVYPFVPKQDLKSALTFFALWANNSIPAPFSHRLPQIPSDLPYDPESHLYLQTSGSTGIPKIAKLTKENLYFSALGVIDKLKISSEDRLLLSLPLFHVGGIGILIRACLSGAKVVFESGQGETLASFVPTQVLRMKKLGSLRLILLGGAPIPDKLPDFPIYSSYGMTEMASTIAIGEVLEHRNVRIDKAGEIWVSGKTLFKGYLGEEEIAEWFPTKDLGRFDGKTLIITGRKDRQFISGGENIQPEEIERALLSIEGIRGAKVTPKADREYGHRPIAAIDSDLLPAEIFERLSLLLPKFKIPTELHPFVKGPKDF